MVGSHEPGRRDRFAPAPAEERASGPVSVYVGNLAPTTTEDMLRAAFVDAGCVVGKVSILRSDQRHRSRGFGFVELGSAEQASAAIRTMNGATLDGRTLEVGEARERTLVRADRRNFQSHPGPGEGRPRRSGARRKSR